MAENGRRLKDRGKKGIGWMPLPADLVLNVPRITLTGREDLLSENHRGIMECQPQRMRINLARGYLEITGQSLQIRSLCAEEIQLAGTVEQMTFVE